MNERTSTSVITSQGKLFQVTGGWLSTSTRFLLVSLKAQTNFTGNINRILQSKIVSQFQPCTPEVDINIVTLLALILNSLVKHSRSSLLLTMLYKSSYLQLGYNYSYTQNTTSIIKSPKQTN